MGIPDKETEIFEEAKKVLEDLLDLMELPAYVTSSDEFSVYDEHGNATSVGLNIEGDDLGILIGRRGQTMASLQYLLRLIMSHRVEVKVPLVIDVEGYKQRRCEGLRAMARRLAEQVKNRKLPFSMEPMTAFERRIIHLALADSPDVSTESTGIGDARKVVISPKKA